MTRPSGQQRRVTPPATPAPDPVARRPRWVRWAVLAMVIALLLSIVGGFVAAVAA